MVPVRRAIGIRTLFNGLGPLSNPAGVKHQMLGVFSKAWLRPMVEVTRALGGERVLTVHSHNGLDEFSVTHPSDVAELRADGEIVEYTVNPADFGMNYRDHSALQVKSAADSLALIEAVFARGEPGIGFDMLALNAAAIFYVAGTVAGFAEGVELARAIMRDGRATAQLQRIAACSQRLKGV